MSEKMNEDRRQRMLSMVKVKLSYIYADRGMFSEAKALLEDVVKYRSE